MKHHLTVEIVLGWIIFVGISQAAEPPSPPAPNRVEAPSALVDVNDPADAERPLAALLRDLKSKDVTTRRKASFGLFWKPPPHDPVAIPPLMEALHDENAGVRENVARTLGRYGQQAKAAVPALLKIAKEKEDEARLGAVSALGEIDSASSAAVPVLIEMLEEKSYLEREAAAKALGGIGRKARPAVTSLRNVMTDKAPPVCVAAATALWQITGSAKESVPALIGVLQDIDAPDDFELIALEVCQKINQKFDIPIPRRLPKDGSPRRRFLSIRGGSRGDAAKVLGEMGQDASAAVPALRKVAKVDSGWVQFRAASALIGIAPDSVEIVPAFHAALRAYSSPNAVEDALLRFEVLVRLDRLGCKKQTELLPYVIEALNDTNGLVQSGAMIALKKFGPAAKKAAPSLLKILQRDETLSHIAASTLEAIGPQAKAIVPQLISLLKDGNATNRGLAANVLGAIGPEATDAVPILVKSLRDSNKDVRTAAANALQKIDPSATPMKYGTRPLLP